MPPLLQVAGLNKSYSVPVLSDFSFELLPGEVHALVGSNGAGKSTTIKMFTGLLAPFASRSKREAEQAGLVMVMQELNVIGTLSVAENIFLSRLPNTAGFVRYRELNRRAREALARVGLDEVEPATPAHRLGVGQQQLVELAGALAQNCRLLILDEPTAALTDPEIERLFANIRRLQAQGVGVIYVSHRMDEIRRIANRITVLRDGRRVATHNAADVTPQELVREMVGHDLPERKAVGERVTGNAALRVRGLIFGADRKDAGEVFVGNSSRPARIDEPADAVRAGIGMVPEDRKQDGLLLAQSIRVNTTLSTLPKHVSGGGWLNFRAETATTESLCDRLGVRYASTEQVVSELSGGNQQKIVMARWLARQCQVLLFDEPTRGIDVAAKDRIYQLLRDLAAEAKGIVVVSSDLPELLALCDRILVMSAGRIVAEFLPGNWSQAAITHAAFSGYLDRDKTASSAP